MAANRITAFRTKRSAASTREVGVALIGVTASSLKAAGPYMEAVRPWGGEPVLLTPESRRPGEAMARLDGLLLSGGGDVDPALFGGVPEGSSGVDGARDAMEMALLRGALERNMPVLAVCRGLQLLNVATGGRLLQELPGHRGERQGGEWVSAHHRIWIAPGSKLAAALGAGGQVRVNSRHHQGLREAQKSPELVASAYALDDWVVEGLESPNHRWVVGVQFHPERQGEVPRSFQALFEALVHYASQG